MAYTQADLTNVERAIVDLATGKTAVKFVVDGDVVEYQRIDLPQLRSLRNEIAGDLEVSNPESESLTSFSIIHGGKGL